MKNSCYILLLVRRIAGYEPCNQDDSSSLCTYLYDVAHYDQGRDSDGTVRSYHSEVAYNDTRGHGQFKVTRLESEVT